MLLTFSHPLFCPAHRTTLGATKVDKQVFDEAAKRAQQAEADKSNAIAAAVALEKDSKTAEESIASRLVYTETKVDMKHMDEVSALSCWPERRGSEAYSHPLGITLVCPRPQGKREQMERLGMGFGRGMTTSSAISHSVSQSMKEVDQEGDSEQRSRAHVLGTSKEPKTSGYLRDQPSG
jgi:hypothetical protein